MTGLLREEAGDGLLDRDRSPSEAPRADLDKIWT